VLSVHAAEIPQCIHFAFGQQQMFRATICAGFLFFAKWGVMLLVDFDIPEFALMRRDVGIGWIDEAFPSLIRKGYPGIA